MHTALISTWLDVHIVGIKHVLGKISMCRQLVKKELGNGTQVHLLEQWDDFYYLFVD